METNEVSSRAWSAPAALQEPCGDYLSLTSVLWPGWLHAVDCFDTI